MNNKFTFFESIFMTTQLQFDNQFVNYRKSLLMKHRVKQKYI
jgi:hypothetical protein